MGQPITQVDAFTAEPFRGNPAAVCVLPAARDAGWMQLVAREMNLSETAFLVRRADGSYDLRWFTPAVEVDLCGHATLASAHALWESGRLRAEEQARFHTRSGLLTAARLADGWIEMDFPATVPAAGEVAAGLPAALGITPRRVLRSRFDYVVEVESETAVRSLTPDFGALRQLAVRGVIVTARAETAPYDIISRFFAPGAGIDEDPVTGSAHCALAPYWAELLGKQDLLAYQASARGGELRLRLAGDRVKLAGQARTVLRGELMAGM